MLSKPGAARTKPSPSTQRRNRKVVQETPNETIRKLQRLPCNKVCADCGSKLPQCINLTYGSFICLPCSGVHREFSHKIKGLTTSSFTAAEASSLSGGNEAVNKKYLAKYENDGRRMRMPTNNSDLNALRSWITCKYVDKIWYRDDGEGSVVSATVEKQTPPLERRKIIQDTPSSSSQVEDLFGSWDAFGSGAQAEASTNNNTFADFDQPTMVIMSDPSQQQFGDFTEQNTTLQQQFEADFGSFNQTEGTGGTPHIDVQQQASSQTNSDQPPQNTDAQHQSQQSIFNANFDQKQQQNMFSTNYDQGALPSFNAIFNQTAPNNIQQQSAFNTAFNQGVAAGNVQIQPSTFNANFDQATPNNIMQAQQQAMFNVNSHQAATTYVQMQQHNALHSNFVQATSNSIHATQHSMINGNFDYQGAPSNVQTRQPTADTKFNQKETSTEVNQQSQRPAFTANSDQHAEESKEPNKPSNMNFNGGNVNQSTMQSDYNNPSEICNMGNFGDFDEATEAQQSADKMKVVNCASNSQQEAANPSQMGFLQSNAIEEPIISHSTANPIATTQKNESTALNFNAFRHADDNKKSSFDAFDGLSLEPTPGFMESSGVDDDTAILSEVSSRPAPFSSSGENISSSDDDTKAIKILETAAMLKKLSLGQLVQVQYYIASLGSCESVSTANGGDISNMNATAEKIPNQQMMNGVMNLNGKSSMQQFNNPELSQVQSMGGGSSASGISTLASNPAVSVANGGAMVFTDQQPVGMRSNINMNDATASFADMPMTNGSTIRFTSQQQLQQTSASKIGMGEMQMDGIDPNRPSEELHISTSSPALPPIEKEGNPFDMY